VTPSSGKTSGQPRTATAADSRAANVPIIRAAGLGKKFRIYPRPWGRLSEWVTLGGVKRHDDFWALQDVSFEVARGDALGVIGVNGSGKSTLLKILTGAMYPTTGSFEVVGRVLSLLELGTGLNPQLTGRQNVVQSAALLAFPPGYAEAKLPEIEAFADLGDFFDKPVRLYSSGMLVRLGFSLFACLDPDVFIVDEALSVGDVFFQQKCARRIEQMRSRGTTMLFVSHDLAAVEALCTRVMVLHGGRVRHDGDKKAAVALYYALGGRSLRDDAGTPAARGAAGEAIGPTATDALVRSEELQSPEAAPAFSSLSAGDADALPWQSPDTTDALGGGEVELTGVCFRRPDDGGPEPVVPRGGWLEVLVNVAARDAAAAVNFGLGLSDRHGRLLFARGWVNADLPPVDLNPGDRLVARFALQLELEPGEYVVSLAANEALRDPAGPRGWDQNIGGRRYRELPHAAKISVVPAVGRGRRSFGPANLRSRIDAVVLPAAANAGQA
jgi:lipopolysaccharide transport system ATP-binding protein